MRTRTDRRDALLVFGGAFAFRAIFLAETAADPHFRALAIDARFYHDMGMRFAAGDVFFGPGPLWFAPLYPMLVGLAYAVVGASPGAILAGQFLLGGVTSWLGLRIGARFSPLAGRVAGWMLALTPVALVYENQLLYTTVSLALTAGTLLALLRAAHTDRPRAALGAGVCLGLLSLTSASALLFAPFGAWRLGASRRVPRVLAFALGVTLPLFPVLLRNGLRGGEWTPITANGGMLLATGFAAESRGGRALLRTPWDFGPEGEYQREAEAALGHGLSLAEASRWQRDQAWTRIKSDPPWAAGLVARKVALLFTVRELDDNLGFSSFVDRSRTLRLVPGPWAWFLLPAAAGIAFAVRRRDAAGADARTLAWFAAVYVVSLLPFFVTARYRLPLIVPFAGLAGFAVTSIRDALRRRRASGLAWPALAALVCLPLLFRDPGVREDPALSLNAEGASLLGQGKAPEALRLLDEAVARDPALAGARANRALALRQLGRLDEALAAAVEATRLDPGLSDAWQTRGALLAEAGRMGEAAAAFRRATELRPRDPVAWSNLARALAESGEFAEAVAAGRAAVAAGAAGLAPQLDAWARRAEESSPAP